MATSSMHKPGWRSRRRSRLSLVERAVPSLGRLPVGDDGSRPVKPDMPDAVERAAFNRAAPVDTKPEIRHEIDGKAGQSLGTENGSLLSSTMLSSSLARQLAPTAPAMAQQPLVPSSIAKETRLERSAVAEGAGQRPGGADDNDDGGTQNAAAPDDRDEVDPTDDVAPTSESSRADAPPSPSQGSAAAGDDAPVSEESSTFLLNAPSDQPGADEAERQKVIRQAKEALGLSLSPPTPGLTLDWPALVSQGFTDPRDTSQPLPANMDQIARALIRQALSDQSSWRDRIILVTSPREQKAKTVAAINFAFSLTTIDRHSIVLVDADIDNGGAIERLGATAAEGLTTALCDDDIDIGDLVIDTDLDRLTLLASGSPKDDILDRFASRRMLHILRYLTRDPDTLLVIDAPPILLSQEAAVLSVIAGQVVLVVEAGKCTTDAIDHALLRIGDRHNIALVLNESSGFGSDAPWRTGARGDQQGQATVEAKGQSTRRRLPKAIAAATLLAICVGVTAWLGATLSEQRPEALDQTASVDLAATPGRITPMITTIGDAW